MKLLLFSLALLGVTLIDVVRAQDSINTAAKCECKDGDCHLWENGVHSEVSSCPTGPTPAGFAAENTRYSCKCRLHGGCKECYNHNCKIVTFCPRMNKPVAKREAQPYIHSDTSATSNKKRDATGEVVEKRELPGCDNCDLQRHECPRRCYLAYGKREVVEKREAKAGSYSCSCSSSSLNGVSSGGCTECRDGSCAAVASCNGKREASAEICFRDRHGKIVCTRKREAVEKVVEKRQLLPPGVHIPLNTNAHSFPSAEIVEKREAQPYIESNTSVHSSSSKKREIVGGNTTCTCNNEVCELCINGQCAPVGSTCKGVVRSRRTFK